MKARSAIVIALLLIPIILLLLWHIRNQALPNDDAANYAATSYQIFTRFRDHGLFQGLAALFDLRGYSPIVFPALGVPCMIAFHGNILAATGAILWMLYCILTVYVYKLCRMFLKQSEAVLCAIFTITSPVLFQLATIFFSELSWICFSVAWVYHILRSEEFKNTFHSSFAGAFLGLMIATRPAESIAMVLIPIGYILLRSLRRRTVRTSDLWLAAIVVVVSSGLLIASLFVSWLTRGPIWAGTLITTVSCLTIALRRRQSFSVAHLSYWTAVCSVSVIWWAGSVRHLYEWANMAAFGPMRRLAAAFFRPDISGPAIIAGMFNYYGAFQIWSLMVLASALVVFDSLRPKGSETTPAPSHGVCSFRPLFLIAGGILLPIVLLYWVTKNNEPRYAAVGVTLMLLALTSKALGGSGPLARVRFGFILAITSLQVCLILSGVLIGRNLNDWRNAKDTLPNWLAPEWVIGINPYSVRRPLRGRDGNDQVLDRLTGALPHGAVIAVYTQALYGNRYRIYEPAALELGAVTRGRPLQIGYLWDEGDLATGIRRLAGMGYRFLLLDSLDDPEIRKSYPLYVHFTNALLDSLHTGNNPPAGLKMVDTFEVGGRTQRLFEIVAVEQREPSLLREVNLASALNGAHAIASSHQTGFDVAFLNDDTQRAWGAAEGTTDVYAAVVLASPSIIDEVRIMVFSTNSGQHLRDISIAAADYEGANGPAWHILRSRLVGAGDFSEKITVPPLPDGSIVHIQVDRQDPAWKSHRIWGFVCQSASRGDRRNYLSIGTGVYVRELQMIAATARR